MTFWILSFLFLVTEREVEKTSPRWQLLEMHSYVSFVATSATCFKDNLIFFEGSVAGKLMKHLYRLCVRSQWNKQQIQTLQSVPFEFCYATCMQATSRAGF